MRLICLLCGNQFLPKNRAHTQPLLIKFTEQVYIVCKSKTMCRQRANKKVLDSYTETFCIYCQRDFWNPIRLKQHVKDRHPGSYRDNMYEIECRRKKILAKCVERGLIEPI